MSTTRGPDVERGLIFLSHSAKDKDFVNVIRAKLDNAIIFYDVMSITPGEKFLDEMKSKILVSNLFVLFLSPNVDEASWATYETTLAEIKKIKAQAFQVLVIPIKGSTHAAAPQWMKDYFAVPESFTPNDIIRTVNHLYRLSLLAQGNLKSDVFVGREKLKIAIQSEWRERPYRTGNQVNVLILNGIPGMGRSSLANHLIPGLFPGMRAGAPTFNLPDAAGAIDFYLQLHEDLRGPLSKDDIGKVIAAFPTDPDRQAELILNQLSHWADINQPVVLKTRWGLRSRGKGIEPFFEKLLAKLRQAPSIKSIFVTTRQIEARFLADFTNVLLYEVNELEAIDIGEILTLLLGPKASNPTQIMAIAQKVLGHAATAHYVATLALNGRSLDSLIGAPADIAAFQDKVLSAIYDEGFLSDLEKKLLALIGWFPNLPVAVLAKIFSDTPPNEVAQALWNLYDSSLLNQTDMGNYSVPELVRSRTRRDIARLDEDLLLSARKVLNDVLLSGEVPVALIDSILLAFASSAGEIPPVVQALLTPGTLRDVVEREYDLGRGTADRAALEKHFVAAANIARLAMHLAIPNKHTLEDIYFFGGDALARMGRDPAEFTAAMRSEGFSSADYLEASYRYHKLRDFSGAIGSLQRAVSGAYFKKRAVRLLARIYLKTGKAQLALDVLAKLKEGAIRRDSGLLSMKIKALHATGQRAQADALEGQLQALDDEFGEFDLLRASAALRAKNYGEAKKWVGRARAKPRANKITVSFFDCKIRLEEGDASTLAEACDLAVAAGREDDSNHLLARAALLRGELERAKEYIDKIQHKHFFDLRLEYEILEQLLHADAVKRDVVKAAELTRRQTEITVTSRQTTDYVALK